MLYQHGDAFRCTYPYLFRAFQISHCLLRFDAFQEQAAISWNSIKKNRWPTQTEGFYVPSFLHSLRSPKILRKRLLHRTSVVILEKQLFKYLLLFEPVNVAVWYLIDCSLAIHTDPAKYLNPNFFKRLTLKSDDPFKACNKWLLKRIT